MTLPLDASTEALLLYGLAGDADADDAPYELIRVVADELKALAMLASGVREPALVPLDAGQLGMALLGLARRVEVGVELLDRQRRAAARSGVATPKKNDGYLFSLD